MNTLEIPGDVIIGVDAGCRWGLPPGWGTLGPKLLYFGFDPDAIECERLGAMPDDSGARRTYVPVALGRDDGFHDLHVTREPACSSFYQPIPEASKDHPELLVTELDHVERVPTVRLDRWAAEAGLPRVDIIKLDTQGSELDIIKGAGRLLDSVLIVDTEVEFNPIYRDQPLFADVDRYLRDRGFTLWRLSHLAHYGWKGASSDIEMQDIQAFDQEVVGFRRGNGQLYWGHALYVRAALLTGSAHETRQTRAVAISTAIATHDLAASLTRARVSNHSSTGSSADGST